MFQEPALLRFAPFLGLLAIERSAGRSLLLVLRFVLDGRRATGDRTSVRLGCSRFFDLLLDLQFFRRFLGFVFGVSRLFGGLPPIGGFGL